MTEKPIKSIAEITDIVKEITDFIESLTSDQFGKIQEFFTETPALRYDLEFDCKKCKHHNSIELRGLSSFFI